MVQRSKFIFYRKDFNFFGNINFTTCYRHEGLKNDSNELAHHFCKLGFTLCKAEQSQRGMELQKEKEVQSDQNMHKIFLEETYR